MITLVVLLASLVALSAFFSSAETSFLSIQRMRLAHMVAERVPGAARVALLLERPTRLLSAALLGNNLVNTAAAAVGTAIATRLIAGDGAAIVAATVGVTVLLVVAGEVGPKSIALRHAFALSRVYALPMLLWVRLTRPLTWALDHLTRALLALVGGPAEQGTALSAAELRTAIRMGAQSGALESVASGHLLGALTLPQRQVQEIMVPRVDMVAVDVEDPLRDAIAAMAASGFLRLPVYEDSPDEVIGYLHVSDLNALQLTGLEGKTVRAIMRPVYYESEHASIARVLEVMQEHASYLVMLVDEFGATSGLITLEDIVEEVVGELRSESGHEEIDEPVTAEHPRVVEGGMLLVDLSHDLDVDFTEIDANTVAGLVLAYTKRFPQVGESVTHRGYRFTVEEADARRITQVRVERMHESAANADRAR